MAEYIERKAVLDYIDHMPSELTRDGRRMIRRIRLTEYISDSIPAADVAPVRHGRWVWNPDGMDLGLGAWCCSECKSKAETWWANDKKYNPLRCSGGHFCGNCGALMDKDGDGDV